jgi:hypothetical protein
LNANTPTEGIEQMRNATLQAVKQAIREPYAWPGGYPIYTVMADGEMLCPACARAHFPQIARATRDGLRSGWEAAGAEILWESEAGETCAHCGVELAPAYPAD